MSDSQHINYRELRPVHDLEGQEDDKAHKTTNSGAVFSIVCTSVGAGILSLPSALGQGGWVGLVLIVVVAVLSAHTGKLLIACMFAYHDEGREMRTYEAIGEECMGRWGRIAVNIFQSVTLLGVATIFLILIGGNMNAMVPSLTLHVWVFIFAACLLPFAYLKTIKELSFIAMFGVAASLYLGAVVVVKGAMQAHEEPLGERHFVVGGGVSLAFNIIVFSFGSHSVMPAIAQTMKTPGDFPKVSYAAFLIIGTIYFVVCAAGYAGWGSAVPDNVLSSMDPHSAVAISARVFVVAHVVTAYPLVLNPLCRNLEFAMGLDLMPAQQELLLRLVGRTIIVLLTVFIASVVPYFGSILSLVSAVSIMFVAFVFPPVFYYIIFHQRGKGSVSVAHRVFLLALVLLGILGSGIGIYYSIQSLLQDIEQNPNPFEHFFS